MQLAGLCKSQRSVWGHLLGVQDFREMFPLHVFDAGLLVGNAALGP